MGPQRLQNLRNREPKSQDAKRHLTCETGNPRARIDAKRHLRKCIRIVKKVRLWAPKGCKTCKTCETGNPRARMPNVT